MIRKYTDYSLTGHNSFGVDARCAHFWEYETVEELQELLGESRDGESPPALLHIGAGSNLLFTRDFDGIILHSAINGIEVMEENAGEVHIRVGAGEVWDDFVAYAVERGWYGAENLSLIPGEVGATAVQNIGAYGSEVAGLIESVGTVAVGDGAVRVFSRNECGYNYRSSIFKRELKGKYIVTHVTYRLSRRFRPNLKYAALSRELEGRGYTLPVAGEASKVFPPASGGPSAADSAITLSGTAVNGSAGVIDAAAHETATPVLTAARLRQTVIDIRNSKLPDPKITGSAGSFFVNPVVSEEKAAELLRNWPEMPCYPVPDGKKLSAAWLIEKCGWKGCSMGRAGVYEKQALVLVNIGDASGTEILRLSEAIRSDVFRRFGVSIHPEVNII